eukprot:TRINITY_DN107529_c0_g1_i1.p1 TRINITY_DN107529_c0_g1~~TRINITY_DN107529_c0_g1_i1.p1  ORF type:complete len:549 (-),score=131.52 TRINITY_DN107529_c0_g1_i1:128-1774(-)
MRTDISHASKLFSSHAMQDHARMLALFSVSSWRCKAMFAAGVTVSLVFVLYSLKKDKGPKREMKKGEKEAHEEDKRFITAFFTFDRHGLVGRGFCGSVCRATNQRTQKVRAVKTIRKTTANSEDIDREIRILKSLDHPHVVKLYDVFEDPTFTHMVLELCAGGELVKKVLELDHFTEADCAFVMNQMLGAVHFMHSVSIMHRDVKAENVMFLKPAPIRDNKVIIIDFGLAMKVTPGELLTKMVGTPAYVAPEVLNQCYGLAADMWSVGVILYVMLSGSLPFKGRNAKEIFHEVEKGKLKFKDDVWKLISQSAQELVSGLINKTVAARYTAQEALKDGWLKMELPEAQATNIQPLLASKMKMHHAAHQLKKMALHVVAKQLEQDNIQHLENLFKALDADKKGYLTLADLEDALVQNGVKADLEDALVQEGMKADLEDARVQGVKADELHELVEALDHSGDGRINYTSFIAMLLDRRESLEQTVCWRAFCAFDTSGDGKISQREVQAVMEDHHLQALMGKTSIRSLLAESDLNGDGTLCFEEFMAMMHAS